ncbi:MAG: putative isoleucine-tRNA ligase [Streblomastix strix]|uniref:Putative isoleucine-tRNA ligase n=1 Tax=Streblomastix strix TaxID=222440 RepID=A0A5J4V9E1_9EUKA|nr:MAG: putative isoleucine-tRNA ligase [Streblomastix strix]
MPLLVKPSPPFTTELPHYGHLLAATIKDVVTRYWSKCETKFKMKKPTDAEGGVIIKEYNGKFRTVVMQYSQQSKEIVKRFGRWIDFDNNYKILNASFMESVCMYHTTLSNFEANQNYKNVPETAITVGFKLLDDYIRFQEQECIQCSEQSNSYNKRFRSCRETLRTSAQVLHVSQITNRHTVVNRDYVKRDSGTGNVHCAPFFGEDDYSACISGGVMTGKEGPIACPVDDNGCFARVNHTFIPTLLEK